MNADSETLHPSGSLGFWVGRVATAFKELVDQRVSHLGLNSVESVVLMVLKHGGPRSLVDLSSFLAMSHPSVIRHLDSLEERGIVRRSPHPSDRRIKLLDLTDEGHTLVPGVVRVFRELNEQAMSHLNHEERVRMLGDLYQAVINLGGEDMLSHLPEQMQSPTNPPPPSQPSTHPPRHREEPS